MRKARKTVAVLCSVMMLALLLSSCGSGGGGGGSAVVVTAADGLNLHAVAGLMRQARNGEHFEMLLNQPGGVNNLDLDHDGHVDYINVREYGSGYFRGYSLSTTLADGSVQQIAEIQLQQNGGYVTFQVQGNANIYGPGYYVTSPRPLSYGEVAFLQWVFMPRVVWVSPYSRLYLPPAYVVVRTVPVVQYRTVTKTVVQQSGVQMQQTKTAVVKTTEVSPNAGKASASVVAPLTNPTASQKEFQTRPETKALQTGGFGNQQGQGAALKQPGQGAADKPALKVGEKPAVAGSPSVADPTATKKQLEVREPSKELATGGFGEKKEPVIVGSPVGKTPSAPVLKQVPSPPPPPSPPAKTPSASPLKAPSGKTTK